MSRLMGKLPFKGIYSPFRRPLCPPRLPCLSSPYSFEARQVLATTYDAITQAEAGYPTRMARIMNRKAQEAREKGEWIDIHDYNPCAPCKYDTIAINVNDGILRTEVSEILGIPYLARAVNDDARKVVKCIDGHLYSDKCHPIVPCVVRTYSGEARWVFFVVDTTAPVTYLSPQAHQALRISDSGPTFLYVAGYSHQVYPSPVDAHFAAINILGGDFFQSNEGCVEFSRNGKIRVVLGRWDEIQRDKEAMMEADQSQ